MPDEQVLLIIPKFEGVVAAWYAVSKTVSVMVGSGVEEDESIHSNRPLHMSLFLPDLGLINLTLVA